MMKARNFKYSRPEPAPSRGKELLQTNGGSIDVKPVTVSDSADGPQDVVEGVSEEAVKVSRLIRQPFEPNPDQIPVLPKITASVKAPLKVELERRIRIYAVQDINHLLQAESVDMKDLLPDVRKCNGDGNDETLALWIFDDEDVEARSWQEWLDLGRRDQEGQTVYEVPAFACQCFQVSSGFLVKYVDATVVGYDCELGMYKVKESGKDEIILRPRVLVMFKADDPFLFAKRVAVALRMRDQTTRELMYNFCLDSMPVEFLPAMPQQQVQNIITKAVSTKKLKAEHVNAQKGSLSSEAWSVAILEEMKLEYLRGLNKCILDQVHRQNMLLPLEDQNKTLSAVSCPVSFWGAARKGGVKMPPGYEYEGLRNQFTFTSFLTVPEVLKCVNKVRLQSFNIASAGLFAVPSTTTRPDEFEQLQVGHREKISAMLREQFVSSVRHAVSNSLENIGKGWFNLKEHRMNVYLPSKLRKLMTQIKFIMQDTIKLLSDNSTAAFADLIVAGLDFEVEVETFDKVSNTRRPVPDEIPPAAIGSRRWQFEHKRIQDDKAAGASSRVPKAGGLFVIDIVPAPKTNILGPAYGLDGVVTMPLEIYDAGIAVMQGIPELEPLILTNMFWPEKPDLAAPDNNDINVKERRCEMEAALKASLGPLQAYLDTLEPLQTIIDMDVEKVVKEWEVKKPEEIATGLQNFQAKKNSMEERIPRQIAVGGFTVGMERVKKLVIGKYSEIIEGLGGAIALSTRKRSEAAIKGFDTILNTLKKPPASIEVISQTREYILEIPAMLVELKAEVDAVTKDYDLLDSLLYNYTAPDVKQRWHCYGLPHLIHSKIAEAIKGLDERQAEFEKAQQEEQEEFNDEVANLSKMVTNFQSRKVEWKVGIGEEGDAVEETAAEIKRIQKRLQDADAHAKKFNSREVLFGQPQTDYSDVPRTSKAFEPYSAMWLAMNDFDKKRKIWMTDPFTSLDAEEIEKSVQTWWRTVFKVAKSFETSLPDIFEMASNVKEDMEAFKTNIPIITALRNPGMRERHWKALSEDIKMELDFTDSVTLDKVLNEMKLPDFMDQISKVGDIASKEYMIEKTLLEMKEGWVGIDLDLMEYRDTGSHVLRGLDDTLQHLDDNIVMAQSLSFSPFKGPFAEEIEQWEKDLVMTQDVLDEWIACQRLWMYLEPIFASEDIQKQLPAESKKFQAIDRNLRRIVSGAVQAPAVIDACTRGGQRTLDMLRDGNKVLDAVQKGLSDYLETKRAGFARFYFLSNDELLEILSQTKEVTAVQPHLKKCFEGVNRLEFHVSGKEVSASAMYSVEGECVIWPEPLKIKGNVESWLTDVESMMRESLRFRLREATNDYMEKPRTQWVLDWAAQLVLAASQYYWSMDVEEALNTKGNAGLKEFFDGKLLPQLEGLVELVRGKLSKLGSITLGALITIEVHARDVIDNLCNIGLSDTHDFEWISQLRYYWNNEEYCRKRSKLPLFYNNGAGPRGDDMTIQQIQACFVNGYEYLGNTPRLVITPLTDRCYITLTSAMHICLGGAPQGPAGTGKTETTKDLAKALQKQCVVFNCSDGLDYLAMGKFFKGLASSGAWACFDEFNRIDVEVLSVVAQQVITIQLATKQGLTNFMFEGCDIALDITCAVFITMNPGYAGRTELPDNLKALFRPMAMMVPDYRLIAEICLFSFGYSSAKFVSKRMTATFSLSSEQLSSQDHYDFGMRAVKSVINAAGILKREQPNTNEDTLVYRALMDVNKPKFLVEDLVLFSGIMSDLFLGVEKPVINYGRLMDSMKSSCGNLNLQPEQSFLDKIIQLYDTTVVRHGLMLVGPTGGGKTANYRTLAASQSLCKDQSDLCEAITAVGMTPEQAYDKIREEEAKVDLAVLSNYITTTLAAQWPEHKKWSKQDLQRLFRYLDLDQDGEISKAEFVEGCTTVPGAEFQRVQYYCLNPKSITSGQLYGDFDENTHEWTDGILAGMVRDCANDTSPDKKWVMFDGPVDAIWIENMNTVLDDNKKLCLVSGEIISLSASMTMMFEVEDLAVASPATVSRCGMIYMEPGALGLRALSVSWLSTLHEAFVPVRASLQDLFDKYLASAVTFVRKNLGETVGTVDNNLAQSCLRVLESLIFDYREKRKKALSDDEDGSAAKVTPELVHKQCFFFSLVWSVGASCDLRGRSKFDEFIRGLAEEYGHTACLPKEGSIYGSCLLSDFRAWDWTPWMDTIPAFKLDPKTPFGSILVPTIDTVRYSHVLAILVTCDKHVLCVGNTGTGKTIAIMDRLLNGMGKGFETLPMAFSASTSANQTQDILDAKMDKRRKDVFGPMAGTRYIVMVDDLNMPAREKYFAQPPLELLRQWMDHSGWYDRKLLRFREIIDTIYVSAMGPPGGGRNPVSNRLLRHYNFVSFTTIEDESLERIFSTITGTFINANFTGEEYSSLITPIVEATIDVYNTIARELLPTPAKSHYTFNLRDLAKVFQGILAADPKSIKEGKALVRLWVHECARVFADRLVNDEDRRWFADLRDRQLSERFELSYRDIVETERLMFGDYLSSGDPKPYVHVEDLEAVVKTFEGFLEDYNAENTKRMDLVLFMDAIEHVSRISRIIRQPKGNALLLGVGGSGRQSLTRLAAFAAEFKCFQIEITKNYGMNEWREDLRTLLKQSGMEGKPTVFLLPDTQIIKEAFLEDVNAVLNSGDVPNIFDAPTKEEIGSVVRPICASLGLAQTKAAVYAHFLARVQENLHVVLAMSPGTDLFRSRLRMYPSLLNCCSIDWFSEWPDQALTNVAKQQLAEIPFKDDQERAAVFDVCRGIHQSVAAASIKFLNEQDRFNAVTPTSYLELLASYQKLMKERKAEVGPNRQRFVVGLEKLADATVQVEKLQEDIVKLQPVLVKTSAEVDEMMVNISADREEADKTKAIVETQEAEANAKAAEAKTIADDAQKDLDEALPALDAATKSLKSLNKGDIVEVKAMKNPPAGVKLTMEVVCLLQKVKPVRKDDPNQMGKKINDYWEPATKLLNDPSAFLQSLFDFDKDAIEEGTITQITPYVEGKNGDFTPAAIEKSSKACKSICEWALAMFKYYHVAKMVEPKKALLASAQAELKVVMEQLQAAKAKLDAVNEKLAGLEASLNEAVAKKDELARKSEECNVKLGRAEKLIGGLGGEKIRWIATVEKLGVDLEHTMGDVLVAAGSVAYLGAFTADYRQFMVDEWNQLLKKNEIPHTDECTIHTTLSDPVSVRGWQIAGLPSDQLSTENALILRKSRRWPLMIDPETQANSWIRTMERPNNIEVIKLTSATYLRSLENGIRFGKPILMESILEELDPALEPLLLKSTFKQSGQEMIQLGDSVVPWHSDFRFYMTTKLRNPKYTPETSVKVTLLNFAITSDGLQQQLLGLVVAEERPDLAEAKNNLVVQNAAMKKQMQELESQILRMLSEASGDILDDESLINTLDQSKKTSEDIAEKLAQAEVTEKEIDTTRAEYVPVAFRSSLLYFCVADLSVIDPMYQYSLGWFMSLFRLGIQNSTASEDVAERLKNIIDYFTFSIYQNVCRSLFEKHKLMFSFLLCVRIMQGDNKINAEEFKFLLSGPPSTKTDGDNPAPEWMTINSWTEFSNMHFELPVFNGVTDIVREHKDSFKEMFDSSAPEEFQLPGGLQEKLTVFQRLLIIRAMRLDKVTEGVQLLVSSELGVPFIEPPPFNLQLCYGDSTVKTPLIFVFTPGSDPAADLYKFAGVMKMDRKLEAISLGQGQGPIAEGLIKNGQDGGGWVFLQNCHLSVSWMPKLEKIVETTDEDLVHRDYRLWLTSEPSKAFPVAVLQDGVKMTVEPPKGLKANLVRSYHSFNDEMLEDCQKPKEYRALLYSLCFYHAIVQDRRKFGPLGWNILYDFAQSDISICTLQLKIFLDDYEHIPYKVLQYLFSEVNYGGRITDDKDRRLNNNILESFICKESLAKHCKLSPSGTYIIPKYETQQEALDFLKTLPVNPAPEVFGLHDNAAITSAQNESNDLFQNMLSVQPRSTSGGGKSRDQIIKEKAEDLLARIPPNIPMDPVTENYPTLYEESMNTVLTQEVIRYNKLLKKINSSLKEILKALKGLVVMSDALDALGTSLFNNSVPTAWAAVAWAVDLEARLEFVNGWIGGGHPAVYWISGFFFPQAFLTGTLQNYARRNTVAIDTISYGFKVLREKKEEIQEPPEAGCYIYGLFLEGARWDEDTMVLVESAPKELFVTFPLIWFQPAVQREKPADGIYDCPVYKTLTRAGTLSTTGHSTNFVLWIEIPSDQPQKHWIKRSVALFCALKYVP